MVDADSSGRIASEEALAHLQHEFLFASGDEVPRKRAAPSSCRTIRRFYGGIVHVRRCRVALDTGHESIAFADNSFHEPRDRGIVTMGPTNLADGGVCRGAVINE